MAIKLIQAYKKKLYLNMRLYKRSDGTRWQSASKWLYTFLWKWQC